VAEFYYRVYRYVPDPCAIFPSSWFRSEILASSNFSWNLLNKGPNRGIVGHRRQRSNLCFKSHSSFFAPPENFLTLFRSKKPSNNTVHKMTVMPEALKFSQVLDLDLVWIFKLSLWPKIKNEALMRKLSCQNLHLNTKLFAAQMHSYELLKDAK
jgi:hypothetical protein